MTPTLALAFDPRIAARVRDTFVHPTVPRHYLRKRIQAKDILLTDYVESTNGYTYPLSGLTQDEAKVVMSFGASVDARTVKPQAWVIIWRKRPVPR